MGYISNPNVLIDWMIGFLPYHEKWGEVLSNTLWILHICTSVDIYDSQHHLFAFLLLSRGHDINILHMLLLCISSFKFIQYVSLPVVSTDILNSSISKLVTSVEFFKAPSSSTLTRLHGCCSLLSVFRKKRMMRTGACLDTVGNTHIILVFSHMTVSMEVNPWMEVTL